MASSGNRHLGKDQAADAVQQGNAVLRFFSARILKEFADAGIHMALERTVAREFRETGKWLSIDKMNALLSRDNGDGLHHLDRQRILHSYGFIYRRHPDYWEPGTPGFVEFVNLPTSA